ncbi:MAG: prepilin-type cleavage/methylation domain-containing protein [Gammaproteobacteria bacterium]|nr:prepilin-type cleavage/methylation domain-containing protein [Gammaproteobacteria bacterium]
MAFLDFSLSRNFRNGFTLIEILIITAAIGLLTVLAIPAYQKHQNHRDIEQAVKDISDISIVIAKYQLANNKLPDDLSILDLDNMQDPWGKPYQYISHKSASDEKRRKDKNLRLINNDYDLYSTGKDGLTTTAVFEKSSLDDVIRANNGKWIGSGNNY